MARHRPEPSRALGAPGSRRSRGRRLARLALAAGGAVALTTTGAGGCTGGGGAPEDGVPIGALIPFTGNAAAGGANYERAMLLAVEHLNAQRAASGTTFRLAVDDTHSSSDRTLEGLGSLFGSDVIGLVGPERVELVEDVRSHMAGRVMAHAVPNSMTLADFANDDRGLLVRPAPAAEFVGCAAANRIYGDGHTRLVVLHAEDAYRRAFAAATVKAFESYRFAAHAGTALSIGLPDDPNTYPPIVAAAAAFQPNVVMVAADVAVGAALVRAWTTLSRTQVGWFFDPALRSDEFLRNVDVGAISGGLGISLSLPDKAEAFEQVFAGRWHGDVPSVEAHLYYDAAVAMGLGYLTASRALGRAATADETSRHVLPVLLGPGISVAWNYLDRAVDQIAAGVPIHYIGASGGSPLDAKGSFEGNVAIFRFWIVSEGHIFQEKFGACPAGTISQDGR
jgi:neutral amino acid transport system substrate-binding protein